MSGWQTRPFDPNTGLAAISPELTGNGVESRLLPSDFEGTVVVETQYLTAGDTPNRSWAPLEQSHERRFLTLGRPGCGT